MIDLAKSEGRMLRPVFFGLDKSHGYGIHCCMVNSAVKMAIINNKYLFTVFVRVSLMMVSPLMQRFIFQGYYFLINIVQIQLICLIFEDLFRKKTLASPLASLAIPALLLNIYGVFKNFVVFDFDLSLHILSSNPFISNFPPNLSFHLLANMYLIGFWFVMLMEYHADLRAWIRDKRHKLL